jgi:hypothetical protein
MHSALAKWRLLLAVAVSQRYAIQTPLAVNWAFYPRNAYSIASSTFATNSPITRPSIQRVTMTMSCSGSQ